MIQTLSKPKMITIGVLVAAGLVAWSVSLLFSNRPLPPQADVATSSDEVRLMSTQVLEEALVAYQRALQQYLLSFSTYPKTLADLGVEDSSALLLADSVEYRAYMVLGGSFADCDTTVLAPCNAYHLGVSVPEADRDAYRGRLAIDSDVVTPGLSGADSNSCQREIGFACIDQLVINGTIQAVTERSDIASVETDISFLRPVASVSDTGSVFVPTYSGGSGSFVPDASTLPSAPGFGSSGGSSGGGSSLPSLPPPPPPVQ